MGINDGRQPTKKCECLCFFYLKKKSQSRFESFNPLNKDYIKNKALILTDRICDLEMTTITKLKYNIVARASGKHKCK